MTAFDKAKVEVAVLLATRWIIAKLRNRRFLSITELNEAIRDCVTTLNERVTRHLGASRRTLFDDVERPMLKPLPPREQSLRWVNWCPWATERYCIPSHHMRRIPRVIIAMTPRGS